MPPLKATEKTADQREKDPLVPPVALQLLNGIDGTTANVFMPEDGEGLSLAIRHVHAAV